MLAAVLLVLAQASDVARGSTPEPLDSAAHAPAARDPAYAGDGRLAVAIRGDLWVRAAGAAGPWARVTSGPAWDREPAWTADGGALVFASDRAGGSTLWRVRVDAPAAPGPPAAPAAPERVTSSREWEGEPAVVPAAAPPGAAAGARSIGAGTIIFVRGRGPTARLWLRTPTGAERRLTKEKGAEHGPAPSPDGTRVAYVATLRERPRLRIYWPVGDSGRTIAGDQAAERPAWAPRGDRIAFVTRAGRMGVWVAAADGHYVNLVSARRAAPAWSPDGRTLALADLPRAGPAYNGDPDRLAPLGGREVAGAGPGAGRLWMIPAPVPPDAGVAEVALGGPPDRRAWNAEAFGRVWERTSRLYYAGPGAARRRARWEALGREYRPRALAARTDAELAAVTHALLWARPPLREAAAGRAAVSSAHPVATEAGLEVLRRGGNVVDAAVAVSFALGVVEPDASGIGGYGQMLINLRPMREPALIEFMTRAPEEASGAADAALRRDGELPNDGPALANVPGTVAGMYLAWERYGSRKLKWAELLAPAIRAAERGVPVSEGLATTLATEREHFLKYDGSRALFFPRGEPLRAGDVLRNPDLARTLRQIADSGASAFYRGAVARRMVADLRGRGNAMRPADLARYFAAERAPVAGRYRGHTIYSSAPPVSGGATLVAQLNAIEAVRAPRLYTEDAATLHAMIEAWKLVPGTRGRVADPGLWPVRTDAFLSKDSARARWRCFDPGRALAPDDIRGDTLPCARPRGAVSNVTPGAVPNDAPGPSPAAASAGAGDCTGQDAPAGARACHMTGTTSFAVADADGNVVSTTQTLGTWGGNFYVTPGLGFVYNDKLASYPGDPDEYGTRLPNARHGSTLAPTIVFRGRGASRRPVLAAGAAGNAWITAAVYAIVAGVVDAGLGAQQALELPRFLLAQEQGAARREFVVQLEDGFAPSVMRGLEARGHRLQLISLPGELRMGYAAAITIGDGQVTAGADPRRAGAAGAVGGGRR